MSIQFVPFIPIEAELQQGVIHSLQVWEEPVIRL